MKDLRALLIDARIELRKSQRDFMKSELCDRMNQAISELANAPAGATDGATTGAAQETTPAPAQAPAPIPMAPSANKGHTANQVGLAWQTAARDLRFSHPHVYEALGQRVMALLGNKSMVDPAVEIEQLSKSAELAKKLAAAAQDARNAAIAERDAMIDERDVLLGALATAVPQLVDSGDKLGTALARLQWLQSQTAMPQSVRGVQFDGKQGAAAAPGPPAEGPIPSIEALTAIAAGTRKFTKEQQEWALGESMVLSGFQKTHMELLEEGEAAIAKLILNARKR
jgi:hypothetical protein